MSISFSSISCLIMIALLYSSLSVSALLFSLNYILNMMGRQKAKKVTWTNSLSPLDFIFGRSKWISSISSSSDRSQISVSNAGSFVKSFSSDTVSTKLNWNGELVFFLRRLLVKVELPLRNSSLIASESIAFHSGRLLKIVHLEFWWQALLPWTGVLIG